MRSVRLPLRRTIQRLKMTVNPLVDAGYNVCGPIGAFCAGSAAGFTASATIMVDAGTSILSWLVNGATQGRIVRRITNSGLKMEMLSVLLTGMRSV